MESSGRRQLLVSKGWVQAVALVLLFGFFVLGLLAYRTYQAKPPTPQRVVDPRGQVLYSAADIRKGQQVFLHNGLMEYGSVFGHGAYLGPDYTADYLRRATEFVRRAHGGPGSDTAGRRTIEDFRTNRYDASSATLTLTAEQAQAHRRLIGHYSRFFSEPTTRHGLRKKAITDPAELAQLTAFFGWTAWAASAQRPGRNYTYTNNWPPEPRVDNRPTANVIVWSVLSLIALLGGIGILFGVFGRWRFLGWHGREQAALSFRAPGDVALTPAQRACAWFFFVMAALFFVLCGRRPRANYADCATMPTRGGAVFVGGPGSPARRSGPHDAAGAAPPAWSRRLLHLLVAIERKSAGRLGRPDGGGSAASPLRCSLSRHREAAGTVAA